MITYSALPLDVSQRAFTWGLGVISSVSLTGRRSSENKTLCYPTSQEKALYIYFNEEGDVVNKLPLLWSSSLLLSIHPTFHPILPNPGCKCFSAALSTGLDFCSLWLGCCNPSVLPDHGMDVGYTFSGSFVWCLVKTEIWHLSFNF